MVMTKFVIPYYKMFWLKDGEDGLELNYKMLDSARLHDWFYEENDDDIYLPIYYY